MIRHGWVTFTGESMTLLYLYIFSIYIFETNVQEIALEKTDLGEEGLADQFVYKYIFRYKDERDNIIVESNILIR